MKLLQLHFLFWLFLLLLAVFHVHAEDDTECLRQFKASIHDPNNHLADWNFGNTSRGNVCSFTGVLCWNALENKVLSLKLPKAGLSGIFPSGLSLCLSLTSLDLSSNMLAGPIPDDICTQMQFLTSLDLSDNTFTGNVPDGLEDCKYLNSLYLQNNRLAGELPWGIGLLPRLTDLDLSSNSLSGVIPSTYVNRSALGKEDPFPASVFEGNPGLCGPPLTRSCSSSPKVGTIVGAVVGAAAFFALLSALLMWYTLLRAQKKGSALLTDDSLWAKRIKNPKSIVVSMFQKPLVRLRLSDLMVATNAFSKYNVIASGSTGTVYKAYLRDGSMLAIKRLSVTAQPDKPFKSEIMTLGKLRHRNLVPLLGYCVAGGEKLLVYKHMVNGSLKDYLHETPEKSKPDWEARLKIAIGAARGVAWLHHSCNPKIIHRNISSSSILLDDDYEPRITDFGLARLANPVDTHVTTVMNGDFGDAGYVPPEYGQSLVATVKGDVYSLGVVLLELVTGQRAVDVCAERQFKGNLAQWVAFLSSNGRVQEALDMSLKGRGVDDELVQFLRIACACVLSAAKDRPTVYEVYQLLRAIGQKLDVTCTDELAFHNNFRDMEHLEEFAAARRT